MLLALLSDIISKYLSRNASVVRERVLKKITVSECLAQQL